MLIFSTERLTVRPWTEADVDRAFDIYSRWEVARWLGATPRAIETREQAEAMVERWGNSEDPRYGLWAIEVRDTGVVAGTVLLAPIPDGAGEVEVGWHLHPDAWGNGYATEAARGAVAKGFAEGLDEVHAVVRPDNEPSLAVCRRLGMTPLGRTDRWYGMELEAFRLRRGEG